MTSSKITIREAAENYYDNAKEGVTGYNGHLNIRTFNDNMKREAYERQQGNYSLCNQHFEISEMEADHITPWCEGGKTDAENCQMLCRDCNRHKRNK